MKWLAALLGASLCLAGCTVGPKYQRAPVQSPPAWKIEGPWREAAPKDAIPKGAWWEIFHDEELNGYEQATAARQPVPRRCPGSPRSGSFAGASGIRRTFPDSQRRSQRIA